MPKSRIDCIITIGFLTEIRMYTHRLFTRLRTGTSDSLHYRFRPETFITTIPPLFRLDTLWHARFRIMMTFRSILLSMTLFLFAYSSSYADSICIQTSPTPFSTDAIASVSIAISTPYDHGADEWKVRYSDVARDLGLLDPAAPFVLRLTIPFERSTYFEIIASLCHADMDPIDSRLCRTWVFRTTSPGISDDFLSLLMTRILSGAHDRTFECF